MNILHIFYGGCLIL